MTTTIENFQAVMTTKAHPAMSDRYSFVNTAEIISYFKNEGWSVRRVSQTKSRDGGAQAYAAHEVRMNFNSFSNVGDTLPELIVINSHNGKTTLKILFGLFRLVCTNGLTVPVKGLSESFNIRHMGINREEVKVLTEQVSTFLPMVGERVKRMQETEIREVDAIEFLRNSAKLRFPTQEVQLDYSELLEPLRDEDKNTTVWNVFNIAQEKFIKGEFTVTKNKRERKARPIKNFLKENHLNVALWEEAELLCI